MINKVEKKDKFGNLSFDYYTEDERLLAKNISSMESGSKERYLEEITRKGAIVERFLATLIENGWEIPKPSSHTTKAGVTLQKAQVDFNTTDGWASMDLIYGSYMSYTYTTRTNERGSGDGSHDGMRDSYHSVTVEDRKTYVFPSVQSLNVGRKRAFNEFQATELLTKITVVEK